MLFVIFFIGSKCLIPYISQVSLLRYIILSMLLWLLNYKLYVYICSLFKFKLFIYIVTLR